MPRQPRIEFPGASYHVMARGNRRGDIFLDDGDREAFLARLDTACDRTGWRIRAFVLMGNHYHLAIHTPEANLVAGMRWLQNAYTRYFNVRHRLWGRLFGDRYKSVVVEDEDSFGGGTDRGGYMATLVDYIHLNPARAGLVDCPGGGSVLDYPWGSVAAGYAIRPAKRPGWLDAKAGLDAGGYPDTAAGRREYLGMLDRRAASEAAEKCGLPDPGKEDLRGSLRRGWYWGSMAFQEWLLQRHGEDSGSNRDYRTGPVGKDHGRVRAAEIIASGCKELGWEPGGKHIPGDLRRTAIAWAVWESTSVSQPWIARELGLKSAANVSQQIRKFSAIPTRDLPDEIRSWKRKFNN